MQFLYKFKQMIVSVLMLSLLAFAFMFSACADNTEANNGGLQLTVSKDGTFYVVTGIGDYTGSEVEIPSEYNKLPVKAINQNAFKNCSFINVITVPDSVTNIGKGAFTGCTGLRELTVPFAGESEGATRAKSVFGYIFGSKSYPNSTAVDQVYNQDGDFSTYYLPNSLTRIKFNGTKIGYGMFSMMSNLSELVLGPNVEEIADGAFLGCNNLKNIFVESSAVAKNVNDFSSFGGILYNCENLYIDDEIKESDRSDFIKAMDVVESGFIDGKLYSTMNYEAAFVTTKIEAEAAALDGCIAQTTDRTSATSSGLSNVGFGNGGRGKTVTFTINSQKDTAVTLGCCLGGTPNYDRAFSYLFKVTVNGEEMLVADFLVQKCDTVTWANWQEYSLGTVNLKEGDNVIVFTTMSDVGVASNFDYIFLKGLKTLDFTLVTEVEK